MRKENGRVASLAACGTVSVSDKTIETETGFTLTVPVQSSVAVPHV